MIKDSRTTKIDVDFDISEIQRDLEESHISHLRVEQSNLIGRGDIG